VAGAQFVEWPIAKRKITLKIELVATARLSDAQKAALRQLGTAVYTPEVTRALPGTSVAWDSPQWSIFLWDQGELVSRVGLLVREISCGGAVKRIGGIGGVLTHPAKQGQGLASLAMREAAKCFDTDLSVAFALLFCRSDLVEFYKRLLWQPFQGKVFVEQPAKGRIEFTINKAMVLDVKEQAPLNGELDLHGLPW
jgi:predicted GNAT family N-acyltransferase